MIGDCTVMLCDVGGETEHAVVTSADNVVEATAELVHEWRREPNGRHHALVGDVVTFGTEGEGEGVVSYRITDFASLARSTYLLLRVPTTGEQ